MIMMMMMIMTVCALVAHVFSPKLKAQRQVQVSQQKSVVWTGADLQAEAGCRSIWIFLHPVFIPQFLADRLSHDINNLEPQYPPDLLHTNTVLALLWLLVLIWWTTEYLPSALSSISFTLSLALLFCPVSCSSSSSSSLHFFLLFFPSHLGSTVFFTQPLAQSH